MEYGYDGFQGVDEVYFMGKFIRNHKVNLKYELTWTLHLPDPSLFLSRSPCLPHFRGIIMTEAQGVHATVMQSDLR